MTTREHLAAGDRTRAHRRRGAPVVIAAPARPADRIELHDVAAFDLARMPQLVIPRGPFVRALARVFAAVRSHDYGGQVILTAVGP